MKKTAITTDGAAKAFGPYSQGTLGVGLVFTSGQLGIDVRTGELADGIVAQTHQSFKNLSAILEAGGASLATVLKTTVFLKDMNDFPSMNEVYAEYFGDQPPARSTIEVAKLPRDGLVEIEAVAMVK